MNNVNKQKHLKWFLHQNDVELFGLLETRVKPSSLNNVASNVCYGWNYVTNTSEHPGGRIWILGKGSSVVVDVLEMSEQYIHTRVRMVQNGTVFLATFIYAFNKIEHMVPLWTAIDRLSGNGPWIVLGDFNNVLYANERLGKAVSDEEMLPFQSTVARCDLQDMKTSGAFFTWNNKQPSETRIFSMIDRVLVNSDWLALWSDWMAHYQPEGTFDHCPCIVSWGESCKGRKRYFKFFNMWSKVEEFGELVKENWQMQINGTPMYIMARKLKMLKPCLRSLNRGLFSDIERNADVAFNLLIDCQLQLQKHPTNVVLMDNEKQLRESYQLLEESKTDFLKQKAKCAWAREGDTNSATFHQAIQQRQMHNKVLQIESMSGVDCRDPDDILKAFLEYYETLHESSAPTSTFYKSIVTQGVTLKRVIGLDYAVYLLRRRS
ncbi:uncharacterized protein LOC141632972 [Silene latifolia]|uniref:uncharacterized protein LOC141632972 n=1 Tax=Silene latifolia TaxID=37657 RepID=UPI003D77D799